MFEEKSPRQQELFQVKQEDKRSANQQDRGKNTREVILYQFQKRKQQIAIMHRELQKDIGFSKQFYLKSCAVFQQYRNIHPQQIKYLSQKYQCDEDAPMICLLKKKIQNMKLFQSVIRLDIERTQYELERIAEIETLLRKGPKISSMHEKAKDLQINKKKEDYLSQE